MTQHFLLSAQARTISLKAVFSMGEDKAYETFRAMRWPETNGEAVCPRCGCVETYDIADERGMEPEQEDVLLKNAIQVALITRSAFEQVNLKPDDEKVTNAAFFCDQISVRSP